jgi:hypothetical protein
MSLIEQLKTLDSRLADKVVRDPFTGCWLWTGGKTTNGYGRVNRTDKAHGTAYRRVHRRVYRLLVDPDLVEMPGRGSAMTLDHLCMVTACCNPQHLKPETRRQNKINGTLAVNSSSKYVGVSWHKERGKWRAAIRVGKKRHLGYHANELDAALVYDAVCNLLGISPQNTAAGEPDAGHIAEATRHLVRQGLIKG